jgi:hypothetical protein
MAPTGISKKQVQISTANIGLRTREIAHLYMGNKQLHSRINLSTGTYTEPAKPSPDFYVSL